MFIIIIIIIMKNVQCTMYNVTLTRTQAQKKIIILDTNSSKFITYFYRVLLLYRDLQVTR